MRFGTFLILWMITGCSSLIKRMRTRLSRKKNRFRAHADVRLSAQQHQIRFFIRASGFIVIMLLLSTAFIFAYDYFSQSRNFQALHITVTGCARLAEQEIRDIAGITPGINILAVNLTTARKQILNHPWVAEATISRDIPSRLHIRIQEEEPLAVLEMADGTEFLINRSGRIFKPREASDPDCHPWITGLGDEDLPIPGWPDTSAFQAAMEILRLFRETDSPLFPGAGIRHIRMDPQIGATVYSGEGNQSIILGLGPYSEKHAVLSALMERMETDPRIAEYQCIDLFDVNRIVITPVPVDLTRSVREEVNIAGT